MKFSLYLHIPYCQAKCPYCDFNSYAAVVWPEAQYVAALCAELRQYAARPPWRGGEIGTIFFGGGTPSLFSADSIGSVLDAVKSLWSVAADAETTLEANPGTVTYEKLRGFRAAGVNRMSFGVQSFAPRHLRGLGRIHGADEAKAVVALARQASFDNVSIDLIFALPNQTLEEWEHDLQQACGLRPNHISAYNLTYEEGTAFHHWLARGKLRQLPEEIEVAMFTRTREILGAAGYEQYEISNYAQPGWACRHNLNYWRSGAYLGAGAGAHSYSGTGKMPVPPLDGAADSGGTAVAVGPAVPADWLFPGRTAEAAERPAQPALLDSPLWQRGARGDLSAGIWGERLSNEKIPSTYMRAVELRGHARVTSEALDARQARGEFVFLGLRCRDGFAASAFRERFGDEFAASFPQAVDLRDAGLLQCTDERWALTPRGLLLADSVFATFL